MGFVSIRHLCKQFGPIMALKNVQLDIEEGEFFALLGPSGCGKTTMMRCIAGFETPTSGRIEIGGKDVGPVPAYRRSCGMVFQSYALFPHLTVFENVAYGLQIRRFYQGGVPAKVAVLGGMISRKLARINRKIEKKVRENLDLVELSHLANRLPGQLSGGQQQRVALARALIMKPAVLLMDEPLSNLDKKLRGSMRSLIRNIQRKVGITTLFVTHDQEEAMSMADRVAVMSGGQVIQVDTPSRLYSRPNNSFVADFVGSSNIVRGELVPNPEEGGSQVVLSEGVRLVASGTADRGIREVLVRPESIQLYPAAQAPTEVSCKLKGKIQWATYLGASVRYEVDIGSQIMQVDTVFQVGEALYREGDEVVLVIDPDQVVVL